MTDLPEKNRLRKIPRNVWIATLTSFLTDISSEMIFNLLPLFLANILGVSTLIIGIIDGIAESTASLLKIISGRLSDTLGQRKWLAVLGYFISALTKPFLYFTTSWLGVLLVRFSDRIGKGIRTAPRDALIADSVDEASRGIAFGLHRAGDTAGALLGLIIALLVVLAVQAQTIDLTRDTFQVLVLIGIVPSFLAVLILAVGAHEAVKNPAKSPEVSSQTPQAAIGKDKNFRLFLFIIAIFTLGNSSDSFLILRAQERGLNVAGVLGMLITFNLIYAVFASPLGALSDRIGRYRLIIGGWFVYALLYLAFGLASSAWQIWLIYAFYGLYYAAAEGATKALVADLVPAEQRGAAYGYYNAVIGLMTLPASILAGLVWQGVGSWQGFGASAPFYLGATLAMIATVMMYFYGRKLNLKVS